MKSIAAISLLVITTCCWGQSNPSFRQFYFNPYSYNPAYTGIDGYTDVYLAHRRQWINFNDAPVISELSFQYPTRGRVALGFSISNQQVVALQNSFVSTAAAYRLPIASDHTLIFALSAGVGTNSLDFAGYDYSNDPAILNAAANSFYGNGSFGVLYKWKHLKVGLALPQLFVQPYFSAPTTGKGNFSQLLKQNYSVSYKFYSGSFAIEPWFLFRLTNDYQNVWDVGATVSYLDKIGLGSSYSAQQGTAFFFNMDVKERVKLGFAYELPLADPDYISARSLEVQLRVRFGTQREYRVTSRFDKPAIPEGDLAQSDTLTDNQTSVMPEKVGPETKSQEVAALVPIVLSKSDSSAIAPASRKEKLPAADSVNVGQSGAKVVLPQPIPNADTVKHDRPGYYVVAGSFKNPDYAHNFKRSMVQKGFAQADVLLDKGTGLYLVHIYYARGKKEAEDELAGLQKAGIKSCYVVGIR